MTITAPKNFTAQSVTATHIRDLPVYLASEFKVFHGANLGDDLADADDLCLDDIYSLAMDARESNITVTESQSGPFIVSQTSLVGTAGFQLHLDCAITLMSQGGETIEALVLAEVDPSENALDAVYLLPLSSLKRQTEYRLMRVDPDAARTRLAEVACVSFMRGTHITMADGRQNPIENLRIGDRILTRDNGPQVIRWIGNHTSRAVGDFAPIVIKAGALNNENDLHVSPNHRLFIYQRRDDLKLGRPEVFVRASDLVNGETVTVLEGGFVEHFQILFDHHQIIYAEGIAAESLPFSKRTTAVLPPDLAERLEREIVSHPQQLHRDIEVTRANLAENNAAERLRRSSLGS
ncbi:MULTISPECIES: Hint domain-containing protein [Falsihalocynthiibacter]|uniref:Hint domain-containing protein n=1 Tax=Falsihalocynthiibacter TaxID=2854182 RepID=UPI0030019ACD